MVWHIGNADALLPALAMAAVASAHTCNTPSGVIERRTRLVCPFVNAGCAIGSAGLTS